MVSVIIVNYNGINILARCLEALQRQNFGDFEIIVVDNASQDGSVQWLALHHPEVKVIALEVNTGFTGGNNVGYRVASGKFIAMLNNDTEVSECWLGELVAAMEGDPRIGICSSRIVVSGTDIIDSVGGGFTTAGSGFKRGEGESQQHYLSSCQVDGACAAAALYRRTMIEEIGFLDGDFFLNHEDTDLDFRAFLAGWKSVYVPTAIVQHDVSATLGTMSELTVYYFSRNSILVWVKNMPLTLMLRFFHHRLFYELATFVYYCVLGRRWKAYLTGKLDAVRLLPTMLQKRRVIQRNRRISNNCLRKMLLPFPSYFSKRVSMQFFRRDMS